MKFAKRPIHQQCEHPHRAGYRWEYPLSLLCLVMFLAGTALPVYGCLTNDTMPLVIGGYLWVGGLFGGRHVGALLLGDEPEALPLCFILGGDFLGGGGYVVTHNPGSPVCLIGYLLGVLGFLLTLEEAS